MRKEDILAGETKTQEFKVQRPQDSLKYLKTVAAFANGDGGRIVFGVDDHTHQIIGIPEEQAASEMDALVNAISDGCYPVIVPDVHMVRMEGKILIVVEIPSGSVRPYYVRSLGIEAGTYIRAGGTTRHADHYILKELIMDGENRHFDTEICPYLSVTDQDIDELCRKMKEIAVRNTVAEADQAQIRNVTKNQLLRWGILTEKNDAIAGTNAFALLTGQLKNQPVIQCGIFKGNTRAYFVDRRQYEGSIQELAQQACQWVKEKINLGMTVNGMYRQDRYELPMESVREMIANAIVHRSYLAPGNIQVALFDDRLEITSPGGLPYHVTVPKIIEGYSKLRNPAIANAFSYMKIIEGWGTGIPKLFRECRAYGLPDPEILDDDGDVRVNIYRKSSHTDSNTNEKTSRKTDSNTDRKKLTQTEKQILALVDSDGSITIDVLAKQLGMSESGIRYAMRKLRNDGILKRDGGRKEGIWAINEEMRRYYGK